MKINIKLEEGVELPSYETIGSAGFDLRVNKILNAFKGDIVTDKDKLDKMKEGFAERGYIKLRAFERVVFGTGIFIELPIGTELQVRSRSGVVAKRGLIVANSPGTIDSDYRGEIGVIIYNSTPFLNKIDFNERIAQAVLNNYFVSDFEVVSELSDTVRGEGGFGSTGKS